jgi:SAM-dependent methyltransferase
MTSKTLDLGCGTNPRNPYNADSTYGIDIRTSPDNPNIKVADLAVESIPFESDYFDAVSAFDFIEHIPRVIYMPERRFPFILLMNEIYRVLKKGGLFYSRTPVYPHPELFRDPTHVNFIAHDTFTYYFDERSNAKMYGFNGSFKVEQNEVQDFYLYTQLRKI